MRAQSFEPSNRRPTLYCLTHECDLDYTAAGGARAGFSIFTLLRYLKAELLLAQESRLGQALAPFDQINPLAQGQRPEQDKDHHPK
ncbi:MAG: hypothetical protein HC783_16345 [Rhodobacteraceae bacterium]|nr:hypothetical protein [Paracoccaceae bacterium]